MRGLAYFAEYVYLMSTMLKKQNWYYEWYRFIRDARGKEVGIQLISKAKRRRSERLAYIWSLSLYWEESEQLSK